MKLKDKILLLPYVVILMFDIAVLVILGMHFLNLTNIESANLYYFLLIIVLAIIIFVLRLLIIGKSTILDKYLTRTKGDSVFIFFVSVIVSILATTWAIKYFSINFFVNSLSLDLRFSPLKWLDFLNSNFHRIAFYALIFVLLNSLILYLFYNLKDYMEQKGLEVNDEQLKQILLGVMIFNIFVFLILFVSDPMIYFWDNFLKQKLIKQLLSFIFSGSLIYFNLYFLLKRSFSLERLNKIH